MKIPKALKPANTLTFSSTSGQVISAIPCFFVGFLLGLDGTNDPTITIYDNASAGSGKEIVPGNTYDASALGLNGVVLPFPKFCQNGVYADVTLAAGALKLEPLILVGSKSDLDRWIADILENI